MKKPTTYSTFMYTLLSVVPFFFCPKVAAQNQVENLKNKLQTTADKQEKVDVLAELCQELYIYDDTSRIIEKYAQQMLLLAQESGYKKGIGKSYHALGLAELSNKQYENALGNYNTALTHYDYNADKTDIVNTYNCIATAFHRTSKWDTAITLLRKIIPMSEKLSTEKEIQNSVNSYAILGRCLNEKADFTQALTVQLKALSICEKLGAKGYRQLGTLYTNVANTHKAIRDNASYLVYTKKALALAESTQMLDLKSVSLEYIGDYYLSTRKLDSALYYLNLSVQTNPKPRSVTYNRIALTYELLRNFNKASEYYEKAYIIAKQNNEVLAEAMIQGNIGVIAIHQGDNKKAILWLKNAQTAATQLNATELLSQISGNLSAAYAADKKYKEAYGSLYTYVNINDSLLNAQVQTVTKELSTKYESEKKENENLQLKSTNDRKTAGLIGIALLALLTGLFGFLLYRRNQQLRVQNQIIAEQKTAIADQKDELKHRTAWQIQSLQDVIAQYSLLEKDEKTPIKDIESRVNAIAELFHLLEHSEQKAVNMSIYLSNIIEKVVAQYTGAKENLNIDIQITDTLNLNPSSEAMPVGRICNELLMNALKYAFEPNFVGGHISIRLKELEKSYQLDISDNGRGMTYPLSIQLEKKPFGGLFLVNNFAETLDGHFSTAAVEPTGTQHTLIFPKA